MSCSAERRWMTGKFRVPIRRPETPVYPASRCKAGWLIFRARRTFGPCHSLLELMHSCVDEGSPDQLWMLYPDGESHTYWEMASWGGLKAQPVPYIPDTGSVKSSSTLETKSGVPELTWKRLQAELQLEYIIRSTSTGSTRYSQSHELSTNPLPKSILTCSEQDPKKLAEIWSRHVSTTYKCIINCTIYQNK